MRQKSFIFLPLRPYLIQRLLSLVFQINLYLDFDVNATNKRQNSSELATTHTFKKSAPGWDSNSRTRLSFFLSFSFLFLCRSLEIRIKRLPSKLFTSEKPPSKGETTVSHEAVQESIMAVDETINNLIKELKQERKSHHKVRD